MRTEIFLIRHAQSHPDTRLHPSQWPLSTLGASQAQALVPLLAPLGIEAVFSSPYPRCLDTIGPFATSRQLPVTLREGLRERLITPRFVDNFQPIWERSWEDFHHAESGCESSHAAQSRMITEIADIVRSSTHGRIAVSSHGNVIGLLLNSLDPTFHRAQTEQLRNPDVLKLFLDDGELRWDRAFSLAGLELISTDYAATPVSRHVKEPE